MVYGSLGVLEERARRFGLAGPSALRAELRDVAAGPVPLGAVSPEGGRAAVLAVEAAVADALAGRVLGIVTAPLNKESLRAGGYRWPGHTELLAEAAGVSDVAMLFVGGGLRVALLTIHRSLRSVPDALTQAETERIVRLVDRELPRLGAQARRIAVCGVNPHAGEHGLFGREDEDVLRPAVAGAARRGAVGQRAAAGGHGLRAGAGGGVRRRGGGVPRPGAGAREARRLRACRQRDAGPAVRPYVRRPRHGLRHRRAGTADPGSLLEAMRVASALTKNVVARRGQDGSRPWSSERTKARGTDRTSRRRMALELTA